MAPPVIVIHIEECDVSVLLNEGDTLNLLTVSSIKFPNNFNQRILIGETMWFRPIKRGWVVNMKILAVQ